MRGRSSAVLRHVTAAFVLGTLLLSPSASAQTVQGGVDAFNAARFEDAARSFEAVLDGPALSRAAAVVAHRYLAALRLLLDDSDAASRHARAAVLLDPSASAPEGAGQSGPLFDAARRELGTDGAQLEIAEEALDESRRTLTARVAPWVPELVARVRLRCPALSAEAIDDAPRVELTIDTGGAAVACDAAALASGGAALLRREHQVASSGVPDHPVDDASDDGGVPWWPWLAGAAALAAVVTVVVVLSISSSGDSANDSVVTLGPVTFEE